MNRRGIVEDSGPDALERFQPPPVDPLLDGANLGVGEGPGAHRHLELGPVEALSAGDGSCQAGQGFLRSVGLCLLDRVVERLDHQSFVRGEEGPLEVAGSSEVVVERALADAEPPAEPINAETVWAIVGHSCKAGLEPVRTGRHTVTIPYGMVWSVKTVTVIGGGLGGLAAAITAAEAGASVTLHEAHRTLGGRWRTTPVRRKDQAGVSSARGAARDLSRRTHLGLAEGTPPAGCHLPSALVRDSALPVLARGEVRRVPPVGFLRAVRISGRKDVPVDQSFRAWASRLVGDEAAEMGASASGVGVFHHDPGSLSAAFVAERLSRVYSLPPAASYRQGSWGAMFDEIGAYARSLGVTIELGSE